MTAPTVPVAAVEDASASSFDSEVAQFFGDFTALGDETPETTESAAGTTPGEPAAGTAADPTAAADGSATAQSDGTTPFAAAATEEDPFKDTTPASYIVNGQPVTSEDIRVFREGGAVIRPEALPNVLSQLAERATLQARAATNEQQYRTLAKVSEWHDQSSGKTYTGPEAAVEMRIGNATLLAENKLLVDVLTDPARLASILGTRQVADGKGGIREEIVVRPDALATLQRENLLTQRELAQVIRNHFQGVIAEAGKPQAAAINYATEGPRLIQAIGEQGKLDASVLTPDDRALLIEQIPFHVQKGLVSMAWQNLVKQTIASRVREKASLQSTTVTVANATKEGQARMAAAARGVKQPTRPVAPATPVKPVNQRAQNDSDAWDMMERAAASAMRSRA